MPKSSVTHFFHAGRATAAMAFTEPNFGGERAWFVCPSCQRKKGVLWGRVWYRCSKCYGMLYNSQYEDRPSRLLERAQAILTRLGGSGSCDEGFPPKPKGMHWRTYSALQDDYNRLYNASWVAIGQKLGCWPT